VAVLVEDPRQYVLAHVKGVSACVPDEQIPKAWRREFAEARDELVSEHIEEDLEAERVTALYVMNHYFSTTGGLSWWQGRSGAFSPEIDELIRRFWDQGPLSRIQRGIEQLTSPEEGWNVVELGCGVGGLEPRLRPTARSYLGADSSFASIAIARHLALGCAYRGRLRFPEDLLHGPVSRDIPIARANQPATASDFVVTDIEGAGLASGAWNLSIALNAIDMLEDPEVLPRLQARLVSSSGKVIQSGPYIWHEGVARALRARVPRPLVDSARAVEWLYEQAGFQIEHSEDQVPWLFFKHLRQVELYSVHWFIAGRGNTLR
jgi:SAM-dependent methyltransferase